jgi:hypothetical protein
VVYAILGFMCIELMILILVRIDGLPLFRFPEIVLNLAAGAALAMALRAALLASPWQHLACWLLIALGFHVSDLALRWSMHRTR